MNSTALRLPLLAFFVFVLLVPVHADEVSDQIREGVRLHDAKDYDGAILIYRRILVDHPHNPQAVYELAYSMLARGEGLEATAAFIEAEMTSGVVQHPALSVILGSVYDDLGQLEKGESAFRRGLEAGPSFPMLHFNLAVNLATQKRWADAAESFLEALQGSPEHAGSWLGLAEALVETKRGSRAFVAYARAVAIEPATPRGRTAARKVWPLLFESVEETNRLDPTRSAANVTITVPAAGPETEGSTDSNGIEALTTSLVAATRFTEDWEKKTDAEFFAYALDAVTTIASETKGEKDPFWKLALPFFDDARRAKRIEPMAYVLRDAAGDDDAKRWLAGHAKKHASYLEWAAAWKPVASR